VADTLVLVDAQNAMRSRWPNLGAERFVDLVRRWAEQEGVKAVVVFDGEAPGGATDEAELDERVSLVGTGEGSADDWIAEHAPQLVSGSPLWLVSSDRELRNRVAPFVERSIGGGSFAARLLDAEAA
jgi:YacP-like NYN domain